MFGHIADRATGDYDPNLGTIGGSMAKNLREKNDSLQKENKDKAKSNFPEAGKGDLGSLFDALNKGTSNNSAYQSSAAKLTNDK